MTSFDLALAVVVVIGAAWGAAVGAVRQLILFVAWTAAAAAPWYLGGPVTRALEKPLGVPFPVALAFCSASLALIAYVLVRVVVWIPTRRKKKKDGEEGSILGIGNRIAGAGLGAARMIAILWIALSTLAVVSEPLEEHHLRFLAANGEFYQLARAHNFWELCFHERLERLQQLLHETPPKKGKGTAMDGLARDPRLVALGRDQKLKAALESGDVTALLRSPEVASLLADPAALEKAASAALEASGVAATR